MTEQQKPSVLLPEDYQALWRAFTILGELGGNTADSQFRKAWWELRDVVHLRVQARTEALE